jgi:peptidoglycan/LPS O-acetylase OafA/YrhL
MAFYVFVALLFAVGLHRHLVPVMTTMICVWWLSATVLAIDEFAFATTPAWLKLARMAFPLLFHHLHPMPFFLLGVVLFNSRNGWSVINIIGASVAAFDIVWHTVLHRPHLEWAILLVLLSAAIVATQWNVWFLRLKPLVFLGTISYSLYLLHIAISESVLASLIVSVGDVNVSVVLAAIVAIVVGAAGAFLVERPANAAIRSIYRSFQRSATKVADVVAS